MEVQRSYNACYQESDRQTRLIPVIRKIFIVHYGFGTGHNGCGEAMQFVAPWWIYIVRNCLELRKSFKTGVGTIMDF